jgi:two-component system, LuxR family, response regulator FixJ
MHRPSVFVVDDDDDLREALVGFLRGHEVRTRGFSNAIEFLATLPVDDSACIITDLRMPGMSGADFVRQIRKLRGDAWRVIVLTGYADVPITVDLMRAGVVDVIEKPFSSRRIFDVLHHCFEALEIWGEQNQTRHEVTERALSLTHRERQVFDRLVQGQSSKEIARDLDISPRTVAIFRGNVMAKMQANSVSALVHMAMSIMKF